MLEPQKKHLASYGALVSAILSLDTGPPFSRGGEVRRPNTSASGAHLPGETQQSGGAQGDWSTAWGPPSLLLG